MTRNLSETMMNGDPQEAFNTLKRIWDMLSFPVCRERAVVKTRNKQAVFLVALLKQSIPEQISQQRARSEIPILRHWLRNYLTPVTHKKYDPHGRSKIGSFVGKSLLRIESVLREEYLPKTESETTQR
jgi:hypothetical protein